MGLKPSAKGIIQLCPVKLRPGEDPAEILEQDLIFDVPDPGMVSVNRNEAKKASQQRSVAEPIDWNTILWKIAPEAKKFHEDCKGLPPDTSLWFYQLGDSKLGKYPLQSLTGLNRVDGLTTVGAIFQKAEASRVELLHLAGRLLLRLLSSSKKSARSWFSVTSSKYNPTATSEGGVVYFNPISALKYTTWAGMNFDVENLITVLDQYTDMLRWRKGVAVVRELLPYQKQQDGYGWDLSPIAEIVHFAAARDLSWRGLYLDLVQRQQEAQKRDSWQKVYNLESAIEKHLTQIEMKSLPTIHQEWMVDFILRHNLPGGVKLPNKLRFGLNLKTLEKPDMRLIAISEQGQAVYRDWKGKIHGEGFPISTLPQVEAWGRDIQIWMTEENHKELLPHWYNPPKLCPWSWYAKWGNKTYKQDGKPAVNKNLKPVTWLEDAV
jgi:hypothetical protein